MGGGPGSGSFTWGQTGDGSGPWGTIQPSSPPQDRQSETPTPRANGPATLASPELPRSSWEPHPCAELANPSTQRLRRPPPWVPHKAAQPLPPEAPLAGWLVPPRPLGPPSSPPLRGPEHRQLSWGSVHPTFTFHPRLPSKTHLCLPIAGPVGAGGGGEGPKPSSQTLLSPGRDQPSPPAWRTLDGLYGDRG